MGGTKIMNLSIIGFLSYGELKEWPSMKFNEQTYLQKYCKYKKFGWCVLCDLYTPYCKTLGVWYCRIVILVKEI